MLLPGWHTPLEDQLDYLVATIMDQLVGAWSPEIHLSRTANHPNDIVVESAVIFSVNDLVAACHIAGAHGHTSDDLCTVCGLQGRQEVWNTDWEHWPE